MERAAAELLRGHLLPGRRLHQRRAAEEDRALVADDDRLVAHRRDVGAARRAGAHHRGDLRDPLRRHRRLVEEDAAEVLAVGEDFVLHRQEGAARVDQVDAGQPVLQRHLLRPQVLLHRHRVVGAAFDGRVVGGDDDLAPLDPADPGDDPAARRGAVVEVLGGERGELEERAAGVEQLVRPVRAAGACRARRGGRAPSRRRRARRGRAARAAPPRAAGAPPRWPANSALAGSTWRGQNSAHPAPPPVTSMRGS